MKNKIVSIIMPCHNGAKYLPFAIESVISQTFTNWELLIIDDDSNDTSIEVIEKYCAKDKRIKLILNKNSSGLPATPRNIGINNATGRYIAFLDCDDMWCSSKLENQIALINDDKVAVVYSFYKKMNSKGEFKNKIVKSPVQVNYGQLLKGDCIGNLTGIYDTFKVGKVFQKEIHAEDYLMWLEILKKGFIAKNTNTVEAYYRILPDSTSANKIKSAVWNWNIYRKELKLSLVSSIYHFSIYSIKAVMKFLK